MKPIEARQTYTERDTILYALGVGVGRGEAATDPRALRYVYEDGLEVLPTMAATLAYPSLWLSDPAFGLDWRKIVNAEQQLEIHHPLPVAGTVFSRLTVEAVVDKGAGRGALVHSRRMLYDEMAGHLLATIRQATFCRGEGGFGGDEAPALADKAVPGRAPDRAITIPTRRDDALIYRLSGDLNPLHVDPKVASAVGFARPVLHGLATFGMAGYALLGDGKRSFASMAGRYSAPVLPGETLRCDIWDDEQGSAFRVVNLDKQATVLDRGWVEYSA